MTPAKLEKLSPLLRVILIIGGAAVIALYGLRMYRGLHEVWGAGDDSKFKALAAAGDQAAATGNKVSREAQPLLAQFLSDLDKMGLAAVRAEKGDAGKKLIALFGEARDQYSTGGQKYAEAAQQIRNEKMKSFLLTKARTCRFFAEARTINRDMVSLVLNDPATKMEQLFPKLKEAAARRDAAQKSAVDSDAEAEAMKPK
jgi:hypothetical protein